MFYIMLCFFMGITVKACDIPVENGTDVVTEDEKVEAGETETSEEPGSGAEAPAWTDGEPVNGAETPVQTGEESGSGAETPVPASEEPGSGAETPVPASEEPEIGAETPAWAEEDTEQVEEPGSGSVCADSGRRGACGGIGLSGKGRVVRPGLDCERFFSGFHSGYHPRPAYVFGGWEKVLGLRTDMGFAMAFFRG